MPAEDEPQAKVATNRAMIAKITALEESLAETEQTADGVKAQLDKTIKAVARHKARIEELEETNEALQIRVEDLETRMKALEDQFTTTFGSGDASETDEEGEEQSQERLDRLERSYLATQDPSLRVSATKPERRSALTFHST